jgi:hypothetical protein
MSSVVPGAAPTKDSLDAIPMPATASQGVDAGHMESGNKVVETEELPVTLRLMTAVPLETLLAKS